MEKLSRAGVRAWKQLQENRRKASKLQLKLQELDDERDMLKEKLTAHFLEEEEMLLPFNARLRLESIYVPQKTVRQYSYTVFRELVDEV